MSAFFEALEKTRPEALLGAVQLYPALNPLGLDTLTRAVPIYGVDLNRNFPGDAEGLLPHRLANAAMRALAGAALLLDIHASNVYLREIPQVRIARPFADRLVPLARAMNLDVIWVHEASTVLEHTIAHGLNSAGVPCLVVEMGVGMRVTPRFAEQVVIGILHACRALGVLAEDVPLEPITAGKGNDGRNCPANYTPERDGQRQTVLEARAEPDNEPEGLTALRRGRSARGRRR